MTLRRWLYGTPTLLALTIVSGCANDLGSGTEAEMEVETTVCTVSGSAALVDGDETGGLVEGTGLAVTGSWEHLLPEVGCDSDGDVDEDIDEDTDEGHGHGHGRGHSGHGHGHHGHGHGQHGHGHGHGGHGHGGHGCGCVPTRSVIDLEPDEILCRFNGINQADFRGPATIDGAAGYTFLAHIEDRARVPGAIDHYQLFVYDGAMSLIELREGDIVSGDLVVALP
ncbi:MAG: hypothetical protein AB7S26_33395 [Sandaracinaceae bacterium]